MRQLWTGIGILFLIFILGIYSGIGIENACQPITELLDQAGNVVIRENPEASAMLIHSANLLWQHSWSKIALVADHTPMDEIDGLFAQTAAYAQAEDWTCVFANCKRLSALIHAIAEAHQLTPWNII